MAYQHERAAFTKLGEGIMQFEIQLSERARLGPRIATGISGAIVGADAGETQNLGLHQDPVERKIPQAVFHYNGWSAAPSAMHMKTMTAKIDELAGWLGLAGSSQWEQKRPYCSD